VCAYVCVSLSILTLDLQLAYCDLLFWSGETLDIVGRTQEACFRALAGRHQEQQATHLNIFRYLVCKLSQEKVEESYSLWYRERR
jgi:hypothetical protein